MANNTEKKSGSKKKSNEKPGIGERFKRWYKNLIKQLKAVSWPNAEKTKRNTGTVLGVILIFALTIFIFDKAVAFLFEVTGFYGADAKPVNVQTRPVTKEDLENYGITEATEAGDDKEEPEGVVTDQTGEAEKETSTEAETEATSGN